MNSNNDLIIEETPMAYLYLKKQISYENNVLLFLKKQIADFEFKYKLNIMKSENDKDVDFKDVIAKIKNYMNTDFKEKIKFTKVIKKIGEESLEEKILENFNLNKNKTLDIKRIKEYNDVIEEFLENQNLLSTIKSTVDYNYIIDCPIELHILSFIWIRKVGVKIEKELTKKYSYAFRLDDDVIKGGLHKPLFKRYTSQYQDYKNNGLKKFQQIIEEEKEKAFIINLDLKKFYYSIDKEELEKSKKEFIKMEKKSLKNNGELTELIFKIIDIYTEKVKEDMIESFRDKNKVFLPIGLYSSPIIANYFLKPLDDVIIEKISPAYYGRYVDDMFFVFKESKENKKKLGKDKYLKYKLGKLIDEIEKLKLDINHKKTQIEWASNEFKNIKIEKLRKRLNEQTSTFVLLTDEKNLTNLYNKIIVENERIELKDAKYNISVYLTKLLWKFELVESYESIKELQESIEEFLTFMNSQNIFKYMIYLEKIFTLLVIGILPKENKSEKNILIDKFYDILDNFYYKIYKLIENKNDEDIIIDNKDKTHLKGYLKNSFLFALSLNPTLDFKKLRNISSLEKPENLKTDLFKIAQSNMFNRTYINYPLINYLNFNENDYFKINFLNTGYLKMAELNYQEGKKGKEVIECLKLNFKKIKLTPRFIHLNHINIYYIKNNICQHQFRKEINIFENVDILKESKIIFKTQFELKKSQNNIDSLFKSNIKHLQEKKKYDFNYFKINSDLDERYDLLKVGVSSISINDKDILEQLDNEKKLSLDKKEKIIYILNQAKINKVKFLVFSELSIPIELLKLLSEFSRVNDIVITGGLEYILCNFLRYNDSLKRFAYNCLFTILPFYHRSWKNNTSYKTSFIKLRLKNDYSPGEINTLLGRRFSVPKVSLFEKKYDLFSWNGIFFTNFNCFELADIEARGLFKNYVDIISASVYNKDLTYFKNIVDSTSRDLHTYVIQSNSSKYGDSLIIRPTKKDLALLGVVGGGSNPILLVNDIDIRKLREFQLYELIEQEKRKEDFKFTPPGINPDIVKLRIQDKIETFFENTFYPAIFEIEKSSHKYKLKFILNTNKKKYIDEDMKKGIYKIEGKEYADLLEKANEWLQKHKNEVEKDLNKISLLKNQSVIYIKIE
ncbi:RNA-directed DNA polymerase [Fusobacterium ulcerans]|uniref:RNA-directed DNA polymerase n=1 Tax=Fusobacterium ulcerans TaxID=861 RepID=UPI00309CEC7B